MNWITVIWSATAAVCLTLAGVHLLVWAKSRDSLANLFFSIAAAAGAACAYFELELMHSQTPEQFGELLRWFHVPLAIMVVSLVWFVRCYLRAGRLWLAWLVCGLRLVTLTLTFSLKPNLNFREITGLHSISAWGDTIVSPIGIKNPLTNITTASAFLLLVFVADASIVAWRRGNRRRGLVMGVTFVGAIVVALVFSELLYIGGASVPFTISQAFLIIALGMTYELSMDVLEANRLANRYREEEERLRLATTAADLGVWEWNVSHDEIWATDAIRSRLGFGEDERPNLDRFLQSVHPDDIEETRKKVYGALEGVGWEAEYRSMNTRGEYRWIASRGQVELLADGKPRLVRGVSLDITEHKLAEQKERESAAFNLQVLASLDHEIAILDGSGKIIMVNDAWRAVARESGNEGSCTGADYLAVCQAAASSGDPKASQALEGIRSVLEGTVPVFEMEYDCPVAGEDRFYLMRAMPLRVSGGGAVVSHVDITPVRRSEFEMQTLRRDLAHLSRVSTLGQLSSALAHELNQPLGAILRKAEAAELILQQESPDLEILKAIVKDIQQDDQHAGAVIDRMRSLLKKREFKFGSLSLERVTDKVAALLRSEMQLHHASLEVEMEFGLPIVYGDEIHLQQVLLNLLTNALDAVRDIPFERRRLGVRVRQSAPDTVEVAVRDQGPGIPEEQLKHVFEPFVSSKANGMGMGLAICSSIVSAHGGRLWAENNPEGGATFRFTLKMAGGGMEE